MNVGYLRILYKKFLNKLLSRFSILDRYIMSQVLEVFFLGVVVFTSIIFASDTFITLVKQITNYGIPFNVALMMILLNLPSIIVMSIPMSVLLSVVMTLNKLCLSSELTVLRALGVGLDRISKPIFVFALLMSLFVFVVNETIVPVTTSQSKALAIWSLGQKNVPEGKQNFSFKVKGPDESLKRLFYVRSCENKTLNNLTILDLSNKDTIQIIQADTGKTQDSSWVFNDASVYTISLVGKILNTSWLGSTTADFGITLDEKIFELKPEECSFKSLTKYIKTNNSKIMKNKLEYEVMLYDKVALPITTIVFVLLGVPLSITPPRVRYNRGFLFSILIIFVFYILRAFSFSLGEAGQITPILAAWLPNIILITLGSVLYYKKVYMIN